MADLTPFLLDINVMKISAWGRFISFPTGTLYSKRVLIHSGSLVLWESDKARVRNSKD
jgi:hypothetical protein